MLRTRNTRFPSAAILAQVFTDAPQRVLRIALALQRHSSDILRIVYKGSVHIVALVQKMYQESQPLKKALHLSIAKKKHKHGCLPLLHLHSLRAGHVCSIHPQSEHLP